MAADDDDGGAMWRIVTWPALALAGLVIGLIGYIGIARVTGWPPMPPPTMPTVGHTRVIEVAAGRVTYIVERYAEGRDTVGYGDADFRTITVNPAGECYGFVRIGNALPVACEMEVR